MKFGLHILSTLAMMALLPSVTMAQTLTENTAGPGVAKGKTTPSEIKAVIELFTSQGCSSCPAADAVLRTYTSKPDIIALSLPVDYWDHLGWKDTLASPKHTARQKSYARTMGIGSIYTPQVVINGSVQTIGSLQGEIDKGIQRSALGQASPRLAIAATREGGQVTITVGGGATANSGVSATVWVAVVDPNVDVDIKRGENRGRVLAYQNVVRELTPVGVWTGAPVRIDLPNAAGPVAGMKCAVIVQVDNAGPILGATWMSN